jgi:hypothetical protein
MYTLETDPTGVHVIWRDEAKTLGYLVPVFVLEPRDGNYAREILHNLNHGKHAR